MSDLGKESIFLGVSKSETESNGKDKTKDTKFKTAYAFYRYHKLAKLNGDRESVSSDESHLSLTNSHGRKKGAPPNSFSLELLASTVEDFDETHLKNFITRKLSKGSIRSGSGSVSAIDLSLGEVELSLYLCYYSLLTQKDPGPPVSVTADDLVTLGLEGADIKIDSGAATAESSNELLVCLIAPAESQLDLFKSDLDQFCSRLLEKLDFELFLLFDLDDDEETSDVIKLAKPMLDCWFESSTSYVSHCVHRLGCDIKYLIHAALADANVDVQCSSESLKSDIKRFFEVCSLSDLLSSDSSEPWSPGAMETTPQDRGHDILVDLNSPTSSCLVNRHKTKVKVTLKIDDESCSFHNEGCTKYCEDWSAALENCDLENHTQLRQVIENYKLKAIQDMNTLSRLLKQAESDHYSLYRCYMFLRECGNGSILLQHSDEVISKSSQSETEQILRVLRENLTQIHNTSATR